MPKKPTPQEIQQALAELEKMGLVVDSGRRGTGKSYGAPHRRRRTKAMKPERLDAEARRRLRWRYKRLPTKARAKRCPPRKKSKR